MEAITVPWADDPKSVHRLEISSARCASLIEVHSQQPKGASEAVAVTAVTDAISQARELLEKELERAEGEIKKLRDAVAGLRGDSPTLRKARPPDKTRRRTGKIAPRGQRREQLLGHLSAHPGAGATEIAKAIGTTPANVHNVLRQARDDKLIRKSGKGYALTKAAKTGSEAS